MTNEQILQLVKKYFQEGGLRDGGSCSEYYGDPDAFVKFAREMFEKGQQEEIRRQKTGIGYVNGMLVVDEF